MTSEPQIIKPSPGTYTRTSRASTEFYSPSRKSIRVASGDAVAFLYFGIKPGPGTVVSAILEVRVPAGSNAAKTLTVQRHVKPRRTYKYLNGNNQPAVLAGSTPRTGAMGSTTVTVDLTDEVAAIMAGATYHGFRLSTDDTTARFITGWDIDGHPTLTVTVTDPTPAPTGLVPNGGPVAVAKPVVSWPSLGCDTIRVQFDEAGGDFTTPTWDSGTVTTASTQLDLATTSFPGLTSTHVLMRAMQDSSAWSVPVEVWAVPMPAATLTTPTATATTPTPEHSVTMTGLSGYRAWLLDDTGTVLDHRPWTPASGDTETWVFAEGPTRADQAVTTVVHAYPTTDYVGTVRYREIRHDWSLNMTGAGDAPVRVDATPVRSAPVVRVTVQAAGTPEEIVVSRWPVGHPERQRIIARFPADENQSGAGVWVIDDATCPGSTPVRYAAQTLSSGQLSLPREAHALLPTIGVWLWDEPTGRGFCITNAALGDLHYGEATAYFDTLDGNERSVTHGLGGIRGDLQGNLSDYTIEGRTAREQRDTALWMRAHPERVYRLIAADINIPVYMSGVSPIASEFTRIYHLHYDVACHVAQCGEFDQEMIL